MRRPRRSETPLDGRAFAARTWPRLAALIRREPALLLAFGVGLAGHAAAETTNRVQQGLVSVEQVKFWTGNGDRIPICWDEVYGFANPEAAAAAQSFLLMGIRANWNQNAYTRAEFRSLVL